MTIADLASVVLAITTTVSLIYIARQVSVTRQQTKGQFILSLDEQLAQMREVSASLAADPQFKPEGKEWPRVWSLMSVFERVNIMVEDKILDLEIVDRLYGYILSRLIENDAIYQRVHATGAEWQDFVGLCHLLARLRRRKNNAGDKTFLERVATLDKDARHMTNPFEY